MQGRPTNVDYRRRRAFSAMLDFSRHFPDNLYRGTGNPINEKSPYL